MRHESSLYSIQEGLERLRAADPPTWELVATICGIHFQDAFPRLPDFLRVQNVTGMMELFSEEAARLTAALPLQMMDSHRPLTAGEAANIAARITLLREAAGAANVFIFPARALCHHDAAVIPIRRAP